MPNVFRLFRTAVCIAVINCKARKYQISSKTAAAAVAVADVILFCYAIILLVCFN